MITSDERLIVEAVRRAPSMAICFNGVEIYVNNGEFSRDVAVALQSHFNRKHDAREYRKPEILARNIGHIDKCKKVVKFLLINFVIDIKMYIFVVPNNKEMKRYKVSQIIKLLEQDGWQIKNWRGDHRQFTHPNKAGKVTVRGKPRDTLSQELLNSIFKQAGWK